jgi:hypothetical protein
MLIDVATLFLFSIKELIWKLLVYGILVVVLFSCSDKYMAYKSQYQFKSNNGKPDYSDLNFWAAHPWKWDPSDSISAPLKNQKSDSLVDVFFIHPTMYTMKIKDDKLNADIDDEYLNAKTDYSTILYQASVFNQHARVFAPRFREAHISSYFIKDTIMALRAFDLAYEDVKAAFEFYLAHYNNGRPIIIASHSQGTTHALRLLKEFFENKPLQKQLVAAYIAGMPLPKEYLSSLKMCEDSLQTGCLCGWRTFRKGYRPSFVKRENGNSYVTNPLTWKTDEQYAPRKQNKGSVLYKFNKIYPATTDARIDNNVLWVKKPKFPWSFLYFTRNYHAGDFNLFYMNVRENAEQRIKNFFLNRSE